MTYSDVMEGATKTFEIAGVAILAVGSLVGFARYVAAGRRGGWRTAYGGLRQDLGRAILLGLEILIVADIVRTVTLDPSIDSAVGLAVIVLVRTFLSFSLEVELEGVVPWRYAQAKRDGMVVGED
jgi:uncharacterized membrane protein